MNDTKLLPTKKVTQITGLSGQTIKSYSDRGWIHQPQFESHGKAGASFYWRRDVLIQIAQINALKATGKSLSQIDQIIKETE